MAESQIGHGPTLPAGAPAASDRLAAGASAGDYVVETFLGAGAMGEVYAGRHPVIGKRVAIKVLKRELAADPEAAERFVREAKAVNQIDHPNVIDVFNFGRLADGRLFLVMDLVEGRSLRKAVQDGPLAIETTLEVLAQIADALDAAHSRGVVHRDLKPDNVMLGDSTPPKVFVLDFGIAKLVTEGPGGTLTAKGSWLGTPGYMAPEQWSSDGAGPASDRYALGVMAYELLSGTLPFQAPTLPQMMEQHFRAPVPALSTRGPVRHHATLDPVLARAMAKDPTARFATARELVEALVTAAGGKAVKGTAAPRSMVMPAVAGVGVLGLAIVGFVMVRDRDDEPGQDSGARTAAATDGFVRIQVITQPKDATVTRDGQRLGTTPITAEVRAGAEVRLAITKPGYRPVSEQLAPGKDVVVRKDLEPIVGFEGVWAMPDGQLRGFKRIGERVAVTKHATVTGEGEAWRTFDLVEPEGAPGVVFATSVELTDDRGLRDPDCQISHKVEYHFDPSRDTLDVRAERVETARQHGRCIVRTRLPGTPTALVRADRDASDTRWTQPPVGVPKADAQKRAVRDEDPKGENRVERAKQRAGKQAVKQPPAPQNELGDLANTAAQRTEQAPARVPDPPASKDVQQAPPPRGDSQVAPQVEDRTRK